MTQIKTCIDCNSTFDWSGLGPVPIRCPDCRARRDREYKADYSKRRSEQRARARAEKARNLEPKKLPGPRGTPRKCLSGVWKVQLHEDNGIWYTRLNDGHDMPATNVEVRLWEMYQQAGGAG